MDQSLTAGAGIILDYCLGLKPRERLAIVCDPDKGDTARALASRAREMGAEAISSKATAPSTRRQTRTPRCSRPSSPEISPFNWSHLLGRDGTSFGSRVRSRVHLDVLMERPSLELDGVLLFQDGRPIA